MFQGVIKTFQNIFPRTHKYSYEGLANEKCSHKRFIYTTCLSKTLSKLIFQVDL